MYAHMCVYHVRETCCRVLRERGTVAARAGRTLGWWELWHLDITQRVGPGGGWGSGQDPTGAPGLSSPEEGWARVFWKEPDRFTVGIEIRIAFHFHVSQNILLIFFQPFVNVKTGLGSWTQTSRPTWPCVISGGGQTTDSGRTEATLILLTAVSSRLTQYLEPNRCSVNIGRLIDFTAWVCGPLLRHRSSGFRTGRALALSSEWVTCLASQHRAC